MANKINIINAAVEIIAKEAVLASQIFEKVRKRNLKRLSKMELNKKYKNNLLMQDKVNQQQIQITTLQRGLQKEQNIWTLNDQLHTVGCIKSMKTNR